MSPLHRTWPLLVALLATGCQSEDSAPRLVGQLESDRIEVTAEFGEPVIELLVEEGQNVQAGSVLMRQDQRRVRARIVELEAALNQHRARLDELTRGPRQEQIVAEQANVAGAHRDVDFLTIELERAERVFEKQLAAPDTVDSARAALDAARARRDFHEARLAELLAGTTIESLRQAQSAVDQAEARLAAAHIDLDRHTITAPADGRVDSIVIEPGEYPVTGRPLLVLLGGEQPYARAYVPQTLRARVGPGDLARVHIDGLTTPLDARVRWVASDASFTPYFALTERDRGRLSYLAKVDILATGSSLADGMPVEVELLDKQGGD